jgi:enterochelin esterase-like enzyme
MTFRITGCAVALLSFLCGFGAFASEIRKGSFPSVSLGHEFSFLVYVPDGYDQGDKKYPVLYLLHGFGDSEAAWVEKGFIQAKADRLISTGAIPPALIVMPGCPRCWWVDGRREKPETAFWSELVPHIATHYRTIESREGRVIAGLSAGGYGAVRFALKYSDRLAAAAAFSPAIYADSPPPTSAARVFPPFLGADGRFSQQIWAEANYPRLIERYFASGRRVPMYLVSGDNDRLGIAFETALLFKRVFEKQPDQAELRVVDGGHSWDVWASAMDEAMTYLFRFTAKSPVATQPPRNGLAQNGQPAAPPSP